MNFQPHIQKKHRILSPSRRNFFLFLLSFLLLVSCNPQKKSRHWRIGFSQCVGADAWRKTMLNEMHRELSFHENIELIYTDANGSSEKQISQIKDLATKKIDLLIVSPNEVHPLSPIIKQVYMEGTPVVVVDRRTDSKQYSAFIGADNFEVGQNAGTYAVFLLKGKGNILEVTGLPDASPVIDRHKGFMEVISKYPGLVYLKKIDGDWAKNSFSKTVESALLKNPNVDLVYAQNDRMGFEVYKICEKLGLINKIKIIGIDGLPLPGEGLDMVENKKLSATILYPTGGQEAIKTAVNILEGKPYKKENHLFITVIDPSNVRILKLQNQKVLSQQADIDRRQQKIEQQLAITRSQTFAIYTISILLFIALILGFISYYYLRENKKINHQLQLQNDEISSQRNELIEISAHAKAANEAKVNFFTNISHEFRTPLTLILGPLEELMADKKNSYATTQSLALIQKNVIRLLRLFNQLIDFRKIEANKMKLRASENDLVSFVTEIIDSYRNIAKKRNIDLRLITEESHLTAWFDTNMLDKVIFNLLSNAFKFTANNGFVHVYISKTNEMNSALIKVEDNGVGISKNALLHTFEPFYQGDFENYKGSGLGLALSKELIQSHTGQISVQSEKGKGTTFSILLPLGNAHLKPEEMLLNEEASSHLYEHEKIYKEDDDLIKVNGEEPLERSGQSHSILIIEDNIDLRKFLVTRLHKQYEILQAEDSHTALQMAFDVVPDLIISDIVIPGKDGLELTHIFKSDIRTSHIPIILLTAKTAIDQQIEGMKKKADVYITKPFNTKFLEETIKSLLTNRTKLKEHYTGELPLNLKSQTIDKLDRKFIHEFMSLVEGNIDNEDFSTEDICKSIGISRVQLYRKVKALLDINVNDYILNTRLQKAKYLLLNENFSIGEVAYKVGFSTPAYFSQVFKSKFGLTPKAFKEK